MYRCLSRVSDRSGARRRQAAALIGLAGTAWPTLLAYDAPPVTKAMPNGDAYSAAATGWAGGVA